MKETDDDDDDGEVTESANVQVTTEEAADDDFETQMVRAVCLHLRNVSTDSYQQEIKSLFRHLDPHAVLALP